MNDGVGRMEEEEELQDDDDDDDDDVRQEEIHSVGNNNDSSSRNSSESHDDDDEEGDEEDDEWGDANDQGEEGDDEEEEGEHDHEKANELLWRDSFIQTCLRIARNDESLVQLNHPMDWFNSFVASSDQVTDDAADTQATMKNMALLTILGNGRDYWTDADVILLGHALSHNTHLRSLTLDTSLRKCKVHCNVSENNTIHALRRGLDLQELTLKGMCPEFIELLLLEVFLPHLHHRQQQQQQQPQQRYSPPPWKIQQLTVSSTALIGMSSFTEVLTFHWNLLTHLSLTSCTMDDDDMEQFLPGLTSLSALSHLDLSNNDITDEGVRLFCEWCWNLPAANDDNSKDDKGKSNNINNSNNSQIYCKLQVLNFGYNAIGLDGMHMLFRAIRLQEHDNNNRELHTLVLRGNSNIGYQGLSDVGRMYLSHHANDGIHVRKLDMANCAATISPTSLSVTDATIFHMSMALRDGVWDAFAHGLRFNTSLVSLDLGSNNLGDKGVRAFMEAIAVHPTLQRLSLAYNSNLGAAGIVQVSKMLPFVRLRDLDLDGTCFESLQEPISDSVGQALLDGVRHNHFLTNFLLQQLADCWKDPIQFYVDFNKTCRPLFCNRNDNIAETTDDNNVLPASIWPRALARLRRKNNVSHVYLCLLEQPWIIPTRSTYPGTNEATKKRKER